MPKVSIITACYKAEEFINTAIKSALNQTFQDFEIICVSDDLKDYSQILSSEIVSDERIRFLSTGLYGSGPANAWNVGIENSVGEFICFLDADDEFSPERVEELLPICEKFNIASDNVIAFDKRTNQEITRLYESERDKIFAEDYSKLIVPPKLMLSRAIIGRYHADIKCSQNTVFDFEMLDKNGFFAVVNKILYKYNIYDDSQCHSNKSFERFNESYQLILDKLSKEEVNIEKIKNRKLLKELIETRIKINILFNNELEDDKNLSYYEFVKSLG